MKNEKIKPSKHNVIHIEQEKMEELNKVVLRAVMTDSLEQKVEPEEKSVLKPEISRKIYSETITLSEEAAVRKPTAKPTQIMSKLKKRRMKVVLGVSY